MQPEGELGAPDSVRRATARGRLAGSERTTTRAVVRLAASGGSGQLGRVPCIARSCLQDHAEFSGYDAATDAAGTTYIGWIGDNGSGLRKVHLCSRWCRRWTGSSFSRPALTGDRNNCSPSTHDPVSDASGRMADVSAECSNLAVANLTDTTHAAVVRFGSGGTFAGGLPQIATAPSGRAWVVWSIESSTANKLLAAPVLLPGRTVTVTASAARNRAILTGPASCLPAVTIGIRLTGAAARHWRVLRRSVRLGSKVLKSSLNGAALAAGRPYTLAGTVTFADGSARRVVTARLRFRTCANP